MTFERIQEAVFEAFRQQDYKRCFSIINAYIEHATDQDRGRALSLKASLVANSSADRAPEGLRLIEQALGYLQDAPGWALQSIVTALALCYTLGDTRQAEPYTATGYQLLQSYQDDPEIVRNRFRLHMNLGQLADLSGENVQAYWHFLQAKNDLLQFTDVNGEDPRNFLFWCYMHISTACAKMGRFDESYEALDKAESCIVNPNHLQHWEAGQADLQQKAARPSIAAGVVIGVSVPRY